ncbi:helix-turn-helix domain-containing protein [Xanthomonas cassavae CFBP 4642]|uniref:Helix-turn-helix domain-containing protein n=1 Tax=Xanthomonas cassavae CFBP 4642 TaxID=1219375 RepID=A0ABS8HL52_9XANT|nr:helix-turn-helix domain-containing protein [Xanthomonas cassavae]MCC4621870.1 helix-turn-helix domain-containing protein [Xanthomonas cassavae CFBP 4642]
MSASSVSAFVVQHCSTAAVEAHAQAMPRWQVRYDQTSSGRFTGHLDDLQLDGIQVVRDRANQAMLKCGEAWPGALVISLPLRGADMEMYCEGYRYQDPCLLVTPGHRLPELQTPAQVEVLSFAIDQHLVDWLLERQHCPPPARTRTLRRTPPRTLHAMQGVSQDLFDSQTLTTAMHTHAVVRRGTRDGLLQLLLNMLDTTDAAPLRPSARKRLVDRARDYALAHAERAPTVLELCGHVGASRRKLQYCFQESLGTNPVAYLRTLRLNQVRRSLTSKGPGRSVQDIAAAWGFWHPSRFAGEYRQLFGQSPSETRHQALGTLAG